MIKGAVLAICCSGGAVFLVVQEAQAQIPRPEALWPTTVAGWVALFLAFTSAVGVIYAVHKSSLQPLQKEINEVREETDEKIAGVHKYIERELNNFRHSVDGQMNGFGGRVTKVEEAFVAQSTIINGLASSMAASLEDRKHMNRKLDEINDQLRSMIDGRSEFERRIIELLTANLRR